jgi:hypothetical protein
LKSEVWIYFGSTSVLPISMGDRGDSNEIRKLVYALRRAHHVHVGYRL